MELSNTLTNHLFQPSVSEWADGELLVACELKTKDAELAWSTLVHRYYRRIYAIPRHIGLPKEDSEDVAQDVFLSLYQSLPLKSDNLSAWLHEVAKNKAIDVWRKKFGSIAVDPDDCVMWDSNLEQTIENKDALVRAFKHLSPDERKVVNVMLEKPSVTDNLIAQELGKSKASVTKTRQRALEKLRKVIEI